MMRKYMNILTFFVTATILAPAMTENTCQDITVPLCKNIGYNYTRMPNMISTNKELQRTRSLCNSAKEGCAPLMRKFGVAWPERLNCDRFPDKGSEICLGRKMETDLIPTVTGTSTVESSVSTTTGTEKPITIEVLPTAGVEMRRNSDHEVFRQGDLISSISATNNATTSKPRKPKGPKRNCKNLEKENLQLTNDRLKISILKLKTEREKLQLEKEYLMLKMDYLRQNPQSGL